MWRSFFLAMGLAAIFLGGEFLAIDKATLTQPRDKNSHQPALMSSVQDTMHSRDFVPPEWAPWTLLSVGAVVILYSTTVSRE